MRKTIFLYICKAPANMDAHTKSIMSNNFKKKSPIFNRWLREDTNHCTLQNYQIKINEKNQRYRLLITIFS